MLHRIREALKNGSLDKMSGTIEVDETFVGDLEKNKHKDKKLKAGRGSVGKTIVLGVLERAKTEKQISQIRVQVIPDTTQKTLHAITFYATLTRRHSDLITECGTDLTPIPFK